MLLLVVSSIFRDGNSRKLTVALEIAVCPLRDLATFFMVMNGGFIGAYYFCLRPTTRFSRDDST